MKKLSIIRKSYYILVIIDGEEIETTAEHPFYDENGEQVEAQDLQEGDELTTEDGDTATVDSVECIHHDEPVTVYNFAVLEDHTYFVGKSGVLVHNDCTGESMGKVEKWAQKTNENISGKYKVGAYKDIKGVPGMDAHHVGQKALMKDIVENYDPSTAPAINVPKVGHTISGPNGIVSRSTSGISNARQLLARDISELRRVYPDIPNSKLRELINLNKEMYPEMRK